MSDRMQAEPSGRLAEDRPSPKSRITLWVVLTLLGLMLIGAAGIALFVWNGLRPAPAGETVRIEIPTGTSPFEVAELLEENGLIRDAFIFKYYLRYYNEGPRFQAGTYDMTQGMEHDAIIAQLNEGRTVKAETFRFTIPEGFTVVQIAEKLSGEGLVDKDAFIALAESEAAQAWTQTGAGIPDNADIQHRLEGYLFPETYEMAVGSTAEDILKRMLTELDNRLDKLPEGWEEQLSESGLTMHELMTIASLIEREVVVHEERALVAGVIYNRIKDGMPLQIDATVQYAMGKPKERLLEKDLLIESPYNTYQIPGLPPGPIASPSLSSIEAALYPESSEYFYYVTKKDGTQTHLFARTYKEHLRNIEESKRTAKEGSGG